MGRNVLRVCLLSVVVVAWPQLAAAQWYVSPYVGKVTNVENPYRDLTFVTSPPDSATVFGVSGGTNPLGRFGFELDFQHVNNLFGSEDEIGSNKLQSLTGAVHFGRPLGAQGRFRPYGVAGGGLNIVDLGTEYDYDFDTFDTFPPSQQNAIFNCISAIPENPTPQQLTACGMPLTQDDLIGYKGVLTFGGGLVVKLASKLAVKADVRYFLQIPEEEGGPFTFWRFTVGVVIHR